MNYSILYIVPNMISGGVEMNAIEFSNYFSDKGHKVYILTSEMKLDRYLNYKVNILKRNVKTKNPFKLLINAFYIIKIVKLYNIKIIHNESRAPSVSLFIANLFCKIFYKKELIYISTFHGLYDTSNYFKYLYAKFITYSNFIIAVSENVKDYIINNFPHIDKQKIVTINRGLDFENYKRSNLIQEDIEEFSKYFINKESNINKKYFLFPGRLSRIKGHKWLIESISKVNRDNYKFIFAIGSNFNKKLYKEIIDLIIKHKLEEKIQIISDVKNIKAMYFFTDVCFSVSIKEEAFGRIPLEAAAMEIPCVVTNLGNFKNTVVNNYSGFLIDLYDSDSLASIIEKIIDTEKDDLIKIGKNGRDFTSSNFSISSTFKSTEDLYLEILQNYK